MKPNEMQANRAAANAGRKAKLIICGAVVLAVIIVFAPGRPKKLRVTATYTGHTNVGRGKGFSFVAPVVSITNYGSSVIKLWAVIAPDAGMTGWTGQNVVLRPGESTTCIDGAPLLGQKGFRYSAQGWRDGLADRWPWLGGCIGSSPALVELSVVNLTNAIPDK